MSDDGGSRDAAPSGAADSSIPSGIPHLLGHFCLLQKIGEGGVGAVYEAEDTTLRRRIALKVLPAEAAEDRDRLLRFEREARAVAGLSHPNVVTLFSVEEIDGIHFLTMELVEGNELDAVIPPGGLPLKELLDLAIPLSDAVSYAHERGIVHRDLKPSNVMVDERGTPKVLDFGLAKLLADPEAVPESGHSDTAELTAAGRVFGTVPYMSPEQLQGRGIDHRTDLFSLGILLYEMASGRWPFCGESKAEIAAAILRDDPPSLTSLRSDLPECFGRIVQRCLEKDPERRFASAGELRDELVACRRAAVKGRSLGFLARVVRPLRRERRTRLVAAAAVLLLLPLAYFATRDRMLSRDPSRASENRNAAGRAPEAPAERKTLVVLPFENLGDAENDYFAAGVTEEIMSRLAEIAALGVLSRTSSRRYERTEKSIGQIRRELGVAFVLEGTVRAERLPDGTGTVRVTPQLIDAERDLHLWTDRFTASLMPGEIFAIQALIAEQVAAALGVTLLEAERHMVRRQPTVDAEAYDAYLLGRFHWNRRLLELAASSFETAVSEDPGYACAYAGLADTYALFPLYGIESLSRPVAYDRAERAARRAIELDESLAEAHVSLAFTLFFRWDFESAEAHFLDAIALDPDYAVAHYWYGELLAASGRIDDAIAQARAAVSVDPSLALAHHLLGVWLGAAGHEEEALDELLRATVLEPDFVFARVELADLYLRRGRVDEAVAEWARVGIPRELTRIVLGASTDPALQGAARAALAAFEASPEIPGHFGRLGAASFYGLIGDLDTAFARLEDACHEHSEEMVYVPTMAKTDPGFARLAQDPRFEEMLGRMGMSSPAAAPAERR